MISTNDFVLRSELMKEVARLSDLCEQLHLKSFTIKFDRDAGADAWANGYWTLQRTIIRIQCIIQ